MRDLKKRLGWISPLLEGPSLSLKSELLNGGASTATGFMVSPVLLLPITLKRRGTDCLLLRPTNRLPDIGGPERTGRLAEEEDFETVRNESAPKSPAATGIRSTDVARPAQVSLTGSLTGPLLVQTRPRQ